MYNVDEILEKGATAFSVAWDSGGPGAGSDLEQILSFDGSYYVFVSSDDDHGPYPTLQSAISSKELEFISGAVYSVESNEISVDDLRSILRASEPGIAITINGVRHRS